MADSSSQEALEGAKTEFDMTLLTPTRAKKPTSAAVEALASLTRLQLRVGDLRFWKGGPRELPIGTGQRVAIRLSLASDQADLTGLLVTERSLAVAVVNCMIGEDRDNPLDALEDLHRSVLAEALSAVTTSLQDTLSAQFGTTVQISASPGVLEGADVTIPSDEWIYAGIDVMESGQSAGRIGLIVGARELADLVDRARPKPANPNQGGFPVGHFPQLKKTDDSGEVGQNLGLLLDVPMQLVAVLGRRTMKLREVLQMGSGSILELDKLAGEPLELLVNGKLIGYGEVMVSDDKFGIKVREVVNAEDRLRSARL